MATGVVARFDPRRGYGFLIPDDGGEDVFVHQNNIDMEGFRFLKPGERVNYELEVGEKGLKAIQVALLEERREDDYDRREAPQRRDDYRDRDRGGRDSYRDRGDRYGQGGGQRSDPRSDADHERLLDQVDRLRRKQERLISLLVGKGVLEPGEIDGLEQSPVMAGQEDGAGDDEG